MAGLLIKVMAHGFRVKKKRVLVCYSGSEGQMTVSAFSVVHSPDVLLGKNI